MNEKDDSKLESWEYAEKYLLNSMANAIECKTPAFLFLYMKNHKDKKITGNIHACYSGDAPLLLYILKVIEKIILDEDIQGITSKNYEDEEV